MAVIGIKIANGEFYSILKEDSAVKKRLVLTTVHDNQKSVQIDLYKSEKKSMSDAVYIGTLVIDDVSPGAKGEPSIELVIASSAGGIVTAESRDLARPAVERQRLSLHVKSHDNDSHDYSDFDIDESGHSLYEKSVSINDEDEKRGFPWIIVVIGLVLIALGFGLWFFLFRNKEAKPPRPAQAPVALERPVPPPPPPPPSQEAEPAPPVTETAPAQPDIPPPPAAAEPARPERPVVIDTPPKADAPPPERTRHNAPVYSFKVPQTIPPEGVVYKIRWGDTLWDIADAFYRNSWLYPRIVRHNNIRNPNLIVSGTEITIPPRESR
jgi:LysM repeat protein